MSGVGQPRNQKHRLEDNSTEVTAMLMEVFLKRHYPDVRVVRVHSKTNIFRYVPLLFQDLLSENKSIPTCLAIHVDM